MLFTLLHLLRILPVIFEMSSISDNRHWAETTAASAHHVFHLAAAGVTDQAQIGQRRNDGMLGKKNIPGTCHSPAASALPAFARHRTAAPCRPGANRDGENEHWAPRETTAFWLPIVNRDKNRAALRLNFAIYSNIYLSPRFLCEA